jgi:colanic acid/amylovoran biosynthesis glycosyltransferase
LPKSDDDLHLAGVPPGAPAQAHGADSREAGQGRRERLLVASYCTYFLKPEMRHVYRQVCGLQAVDTFVITKYRQHADEYPFGDVIEIGTPPVNPLRRAFGKYIRRLPPLVYRGEFEITRRILIRRDPDLMHVYFGNTGVHLLPLIRAWDRPTVLSFHGMDVQARPEEKGYLQRLREVLKIVPVVLVRSESIGKRLIELGCAEEKIRLNRTGIPLDGFPVVERTTPVDGAWHFVQACRLIPKKGLPTALRAFQIVSKRFPKARFTIAGAGPMQPELERLSGELGLSERARFTGFLNQARLRELYEQAHVFLHPSELAPDANQEGVPNSMLEAMASGLPVVATHHGGIPEAVEHEGQGLLVPEKQPAALAEAICRLCGDIGLWSRLRRSAARRVAEEFAQGRQIERLEAAYFEAVRLWRFSRRHSSPPTQSCLGGALEELGR